jgi:putative ATP-binding cassette transporter
MNLFVLLLRSAWRTVLLASLLGAVSGIASVGLIALIHQTVRDPQGSSALMVALFITFCVVVLATRIVTQVLLTRIAQNSVSQVRMRLCRRILDSPLRRLEQIGDHRMLAALTGDGITISLAANGLPVLCVNVVILICGGVYLGWLSPGLLVCAIVLCVLGIASFQVSGRFAHRYVKQGREAQDVLLKQIRTMIDGVKELKLHRDRRREFVDAVLSPADAEVRDNQTVGYSLQGAAISWGRLLFFVTIGLLLFAWPRTRQIDGATLTGYVLVILYLMSPLERIMAWLPLLERALVSMRKIQRLGLALEEEQPETCSAATPGGWESIELASVTHTYHRQGEAHDFLLGPIELTLEPGEIVFVIGGNGSGKTTLAKLITGLYVPEEGEIRLDDRPVTPQNREAYRQLFSVIFDNAVVFESLLGMEGRDLDERAQDYLRQLELDGVVTVTDGVFSTTQLSRGQRKRLALVTAYLEDRPIYVFDEWAADQDPTFKRVFYERLLPELRLKGKTVVAITHDDRYFSAADRVVKLEEGKIVQQQEAPQEAPQEALADKT